MSLDLREKEWADWMRAGLAGDSVSYCRLLDELAARLRRQVAVRMLKTGAGSSEVEDIVQETLLAIHLKRHTWRSSAAIGPWISAIARNKVIDVLRRRGRRQEVPLDTIAEHDVPANVPEPADALDVAAVLDTLGSRQQQIVRMVSIEGRSAVSVAAELGMSEVAVRVSLHRSLRKLAERLREVKP